MPPTRPRTSTDADAFGRAVFGGKPFVGTAALAAGIITPHDLRRRFTRVLPDIHLLNGADYDAHAKVRAAWLWAPKGAVIAGFGAALLYGEKHLAGDAVHRAVDIYLPCTARAPHGIRIHPVRHEFRTVELSQIASIRCTSAQRTAMDLARWQPHPAAVIEAVDAVCNATQTPIDSVTRYAETARGLHGRRRALGLFPQCDHRADSPPETRLRLLIADSPLPDPEPQVKIRDSYGQRIATADLGYRRERVALFYDGEAHLQREQRDWDADVTARLAEEGWLSLRITAGMMYDPATLLRRTSTMLRQQGFPPAQSSPATSRSVAPPAVQPD